MKDFGRWFKDFEVQLSKEELTAQAEHESQRILAEQAKAGTLSPVYVTMYCDICVKRYYLPTTMDPTVYCGCCMVGAP